MTKNPGFETRAIRYAQQRTQENEHSEPIYTTSSFVFDNAAHAAAVFSGEKSGNIYGRFHNPTVRTFERRLAELESAPSCVATASGMSAIYATFVTLLQSGDHIVVSKSVFGSTIVLIENYLKKFNITASYVSLTSLDAWQAAIRPNTRLLFAETPSNPLTEIVDIKALAEIAHASHAKLIIDNCFCTPALQQPITLGCDIVIHSATKYLDGQGRSIGGAVVGDQEIVGEKIFNYLKTAGPSMSPFNAWNFNRGLETLFLRMTAHSHSAQTLAKWLNTHQQVKRVYYPGLTYHPQFALAKKQQRLPGGIVSFEVGDSQAAAWAVIDRFDIISITANLGDVKSTATHPATTTHSRITAQQRIESGIQDNLIRLSVGLESTEDLIADLEQALMVLSA